MFMLLPCWIDDGWDVTEQIMKIILAGGSGQLGQILARHFSKRGDEIVVLSRQENSPQKHSNTRNVAWDARTQGDWCGELDGADVVINLAGRSVDCRYHKANRRKIIDSRVESTKAIVDAIAASANPPKLLLQSSTATIYSHRYDAPNDDVTGVIGGDEPNVPETWQFSIDVAKAWEAAATAVDLPQTRLVLLRSAMVMSPDRGGVLSVLLRLLRLGLGGTNGDGKQFVSWIHDQDFVASINWIIDHPELDGAIDLASPGPVPNREFTGTLRRSWGKKIGLPATRWMLEIGAFFMRTETELILKSRRVIPTRLIESGFKFAYSEWSVAADDLCKRFRAL